MIAGGKPSIAKEDIIKRVSEGNILAHYFNINKVPCVVKSPIREDSKPSFAFYSSDGKSILWVDYATKECGNLFSLLGRIWSMSYEDTLVKINNDIIQKSPTTIRKTNKCTIQKSADSSTDLQCKVREWKDYDIEYWNSYGISIKWLNYAEVYPISHKIIIKENKRYTFGADKLAYAYVEHKENKTTLKIYQPFNKSGFKWINKHDSSVISLWTKVPKEGNIICICSSLKDALCLWANMNIPSIAVQGEGFSISETAQKELKRRFKKVYILLDNDEVGLKDGEKLSGETGFTNLILPIFEGGKDISDLYRVKGKDFFIKTIKNLFL